MSYMGEAMDVAVAGQTFHNSYEPVLQVPLASSIQAANLTAVRTCKDSRFVDTLDSSTQGGAWKSPSLTTIAIRRFGTTSYWSGLLEASFAKRFQGAVAVRAQAFLYQCSCCRMTRWIEKR